MESNFIKIKDTEKRTDSLLQKINFWTGFSSVLSVFGNQNKFNISDSGQEADYKALNSDWEIIGQDIQNAMHKDFKFTKYE